MNVTTKLRVGAVLVVGVLVAGCQPSASSAGSAPAVASSEPGESVPPSAAASQGSISHFTLSSSGFGGNEAIPMVYSCDGDGVSPPLEWTGAPGDTVAYALIVDDPDANGFVHWVVGNISAILANFPEGYSTELPEEAAQGQTDAGTIGYVGMCPPSGTHTYVFTLYALSEPAGVTEGVTAAELRAAIEGKVLAEGILRGTYSR